MFFQHLRMPLSEKFASKDWFRETTGTWPLLFSKLSTCHNYCAVCYTRPLKNILVQQRLFFRWKSVFGKIFSSTCNCPFVESVPARITFAVWFQEQTGTSDSHCRARTCNCYFVKRLLRGITFLLGFGKIKPVARSRSTLINF